MTEESRALLNQISQRRQAERAFLMAKGMDADAATQTIETDIETKLRATVDALQADIGLATDPAGSTTLNAILNETNSKINASPAVYVKALARMVKTNHKTDIREIRLMLRELSTLDTLG